MFVSKRRRRKVFPRCRVRRANGGSGRFLPKELRAMGAVEVVQDKHGYVTATIPDPRPAEEQAAASIPVMGWIAHLDTAPDTSGKDVRPKLIDYCGGSIRLESGVEIPESEGLKALCGGHACRYRRSTLSVPTTRRRGGGDHDEFCRPSFERKIGGQPHRHGKIRIAFTPDRKVGRGTDFLISEGFGADFAYTVDGELPGEINKETFSAEQFLLKVKGLIFIPERLKT